MKILKEWFFRAGIHLLALNSKKPDAFPFYRRHIFGYTRNNLFLPCSPYHCTAVRRGRLQTRSHSVPRSSSMNACTLGAFCQPWFQLLKITLRSIFVEVPNQRRKKLLCTKWGEKTLTYGPKSMHNRRATGSHTLSKKKIFESETFQHSTRLTTDALI